MYFAGKGETEGSVRMMKSCFFSSGFVLFIQFFAWNILRDETFRDDTQHFSSPLLCSKVVLSELSPILRCSVLICTAVLNLVLISLNKCNHG